jgi:hypothetical protein
MVDFGFFDRSGALRSIRRYRQIHAETFILPSALMAITAPRVRLDAQRTL